MPPEERARKAQEMNARLAELRSKPEYQAEQKRRKELYERLMRAYLTEPPADGGVGGVNWGKEVGGRRPQDGY